MDRPLRACAQPGCPNLVRHRGPCPQHRRPTFRELGYDSRWDQLSREVRQLQPTCVLCGRPARETHHDTPVRAGGMVVDRRKVRPLCTSCHVRITAQTRGTPTERKRHR